LTEANATTETDQVLAHLTALRGQPVRLTLLEANSRERYARLHGVLIAVRGTELTIDCVDSVPALPEGTPVAVEAMVRGVQTWFNTHLSSKVRRSAPQLMLVLPEKLQQVQRRLHPRVDLEGPVHVVVKRTGQVIAATLRDISAGGASIRLPSAVEVGEMIQLIFNLGSGLAFENLKGEVVRCNAAADGGAIIGLMFRCSDEQRETLSQWVNQRLSS
jgi:c-di-GMP-binding flagellar brake protein YcgR